MDQAIEHMSLPEEISLHRVSFHRPRMPDEVMKLRWREREIATVVYALRAATAKDVLENISQNIRDASVRTILNRLVAKGILRRLPSGRAFIYLPVMSWQESGYQALRRFAEDHFDGSLRRAARTMQALTARPRVGPVDRKGLADLEGGSPKPLAATRNVRK